MKKKTLKRVDIYTYILKLFETKNTSEVSYK